MDIAGARDLYSMSGSCCPNRRWPTAREEVLESAGGEQDRALDTTRTRCVARQLYGPSRAKLRQRCFTCMRHAARGASRVLPRRAICLAYGYLGQQSDRAAGNTQSDLKSLAAGRALQAKLPHCNYGGC